MYTHEKLYDEQQAERKTSNYYRHYPHCILGKPISNHRTYGPNEEQDFRNLEHCRAGLELDKPASLVALFNHVLARRRFGK